MVKNERMIRDFVNAITAEVNDRREQIERDSVTYVEGELKAAEVEILEEVFAEVGRKSSEIKGSVGRDISTRLGDCRRMVTLHRAELAEGVFQKAEQKITEFTKSESYEGFVLASAKNAARLLGSDCVIFVRDADIPLAAKIRDEVGCPVEVSEDIILGGIIAKSGNLVADDSLDARFCAEKEAFRENYSIEI